MRWMRVILCSADIQRRAEYDHRILDGADAGESMAEFKKTLENWSGNIVA
jgi:pyruvate/2-oxoglutarate dehydrogenase complex dihydrolipoamide acyltransferase (E2) component